MLRVAKPSGSGGPMAEATAASRPAAAAAVFSALRRSALAAAAGSARSGPLLGGAASPLLRELAALRAAGHTPPRAAAAAFGLRRQFSTAAASASPSATGLVANGLVAGGDGARRAIALWLGGCTAWVFTMVTIGGLTRLTKSGLSMTDWKFVGTLPPRTDEEWAQEFNLYKQSPEAKRVHSGINLNEFKFIFWMEYGHRMWGRLLGLAVLGPGAYFAWRGMLTAPLTARIGLLFSIGGAQAFVGWWMVKSGLEEPPGPHDVPRVSPYRLATHLAVAFGIYAGMLWTTLQVAFPTSTVPPPPEALAAARRLRLAAVPVAALIAVTAASGAFVAGLDAGRAYNTYPLMEGRWFPAAYWSDLQPRWRNAFENVAAVQFHHRTLAASTLLAVGALWARARALPALGRGPRLAMQALLAVTAGQVALGIYTLLQAVPPYLGSMHQAGAMTLFSAVIALLHTLKGPPKGPASAVVPLALLAAGAAGAAYVAEPLGAAPPKLGPAEGGGKVAPPVRG